MTDLGGGGNGPQPKGTETPQPEVQSTIPATEDTLTGENNQTVEAKGGDNLRGAGNTDSRAKGSERLKQRLKAITIADWLGIAGLIFALPTALWNLYNLALGSDVKLLAPETVLFMTHDYSDDEKGYLRLSARMAYTNSGAAGYDETVGLEEVSFEAAGQQVVHRWHDVHKVSPGTGGGPEIEYVEEAAPVAIRAGGSVSREIYFAPFEIRCSGEDPDCERWRNYVKTSDFADGLTAGQPLELTFTSQLLGEDEPLVQRCEVEVSAKMISDLKNKGYYSAACWPARQVSAS